MALEWGEGLKMRSFESYFSSHAVGFWLAMLIVVVLLAGWVLYSSLSQSRMRSKYESLIRSVDSGNVPAMLADYLNTVHAVSRQTSEMERRVTLLDEVRPSLLRHVGLVRFSPFHDTGGDQSFSLAMLNGRGDGVVISALHSRHEHKLYAKPVVGRASTYPLTVEEQQAISDSMVEAG